MDSAVAAEVRRVTAPSVTAGPGREASLSAVVFRGRRTRGSGPLTVFCLPGRPLRHAPLSAGSDSEAAHHSRWLPLVHQADRPARLNLPKV